MNEATVAPMNDNPWLEASKIAEAVFDPKAVEQFPLPTTRKYTPKQIKDMLKEGVRIHQTGDTVKAMSIYREVLLDDRQNAEALYFATIALSQQNQPEEKVLLLMKHAVAAVPNTPEAHYNLGILLHRMGKESEALPRFLHAVALMPALTEAKTSLGGAYLNLGDKERGKEWLTAAATTNTGLPDSVYSRAFARLTLGRLYDGWVDYDSRWHTASFLVENRRNFGPKARHWNGRPIPGKHLYIHTEQGAGDVIMFSRFIEQVAARSQAAKIVLEVGESLVDHLAQLPGVDYVIPSNTPVPEDAWPVHYYLPMMGMMRQVGFFNYGDTPQPEGWLMPREGFEVEVQQPGETRLLKIGIAWAGSKAHKNDRYRTIAWPQFRDELLEPLQGVAQFYSFQVGERARDIDDCGPLRAGVVTDLTPQLKTFAHTASALAQMDLVLAVDTATVHAAASLINGPATHVLIPSAPDWRWLLHGKSTPWYSRMTLWRQNSAADWTGPLRALRDHVILNAEASK